jgi:hypothetical protein
VFGVGAISGTFAPGPPLAFLRSYKRYRHARIKVGAIFARFEVTKASMDILLKFHTQLFMIPCFDKAMPKEIAGKPVFDCLREIYDFIESVVLPTFEAFV